MRSPTTSDPRQASAVRPDVPAAGAGGTSDAGVARARVGLVRGARQTATLGWRSLAQLRHTPTDLVGYVVQPVVSLVLFTFVFGGAIAGSTGQYLTAAVPGIMAQGTLFTTTGTGIGLHA